MMAKVGAIRKVVPWSVIYQAMFKKYGVSGFVCAIKPVFLLCHCEEHSPDREAYPKGKQSYPKIANGFLLKKVILEDYLSLRADRFASLREVRNDSWF
jgi:hypothetical protein